MLHIVDGNVKTVWFGCLAKPWLRLGRWRMCVRCLRRHWFVVRTEAARCFRGLVDIVKLTYDKEYCSHARTARSARLQAKDLHKGNCWNACPASYCQGSAHACAYKVWIRYEVIGRARGGLGANFSAQADPRRWTYGPLPWAWTLNPIFSSIPLDFLTTGYLKSECWSWLAPQCNHYQE